jgi:hypothetical protein
MSSDESRLSRRVSRRRFLRLASGAVAGAVTAASGGTLSAEPATALETCFWRKESTQCQSGVLVEKWCYICCAGFDCETMWCEWRPVGSC